MKKILAITIAISLLFGTLLLNGCSDDSNSFLFPKSELPSILFQEFKIPQFPTARDQLNYAKSGFSNPEEKRAAFKILFLMFPEHRIECGNAALELAYMNFGHDYRFAKKKDYYNAIQAYHDVIENFKAHRRILVKAYWYLGWIHCDLLGEKEQGLQYLWHVARMYPDINTGIFSPVPWVSLVYPLTVKGNLSSKNKPKKQWASLALLEIIRHATNENEVFKAFDILWKNYKNSVSTGIAIKSMLTNKNHAQKVLPHIKTYLALNIANEYLAKEINNRAKEY